MNESKQVLERVTVKILHAGEWPLLPMAAATANMDDSRSRTPVPDPMTKHHSRSPCDVSLFDSFNEEFLSSTGPERQHDDSPQILNDDLDSVRLFCQQVIGIDYDSIPPSVTDETDEEITITIERIELMCRESSTVMKVAKIDRSLVVIDALTHASATTGDALTSEPIIDALTSEPIPERAWKSFIAPLRYQGDLGRLFDSVLSQSFDVGDTRRAHGRPPDFLPSMSLRQSHTSDQHDTSVTFLTCLYLRIQKQRTSVMRGFLSFLAHPQLFSSCFLILLSLHLITINLTPVPDLLRNAGFRAVLAIVASVGDCVAANDCDRATRSQTSNLGAFKSIIGSIPRPDRNNQPCGLTFSPLLADSGVCLDIHRSCSTCDVIISDA